MLFAAFAAVIALTGCNDAAVGADAAERIQVDDTHVYLAPTGDPSTFQLTPIVYPIATASQKVYYKLADTSDKKYLSVDENGVLQAKGELKTDEEGNNLDIIVRIISAARYSRRYRHDRNGCRRTYSFRGVHRGRRIAGRRRSA